VSFFPVPGSAENGRALTYDYSASVNVSASSDTIPFATADQQYAFVEMASSQVQVPVRGKDQRGDGHRSGVPRGAREALRAPEVEAAATPLRALVLLMAMPAKRRTSMARRMPPFAANGPEPRLILDYPYGLNENITTAPGECSEGANFDLEAFRTSFVPRPCYDLKGTAPNAGKLTGYCSS
jgi:hypothetical protein